MDVDLKPLYTPLEILQQLVSSRDVLRMLEQKKTTHLVLMPWNSKINKHNEYRVFVSNYSIRAMSQQHWGCNCGITRKEAIVACNAAIDLFHDKLKQELPKWSEMVLDIWVDYETKTTYLIEVNPGERWTSSGSSLFEWRVDIDILHQDLPLLEIPTLAEMSLESSLMDATG